MIERPVNSLDFWKTVILKNVQQGKCVFQLALKVCFLLSNSHHCFDAKHKVLTCFYFQSSNLAHSTDLDTAKTMETTRSPQTPQKTGF